MPADPGNDRERHLGGRLLWFVILWLAGVLTLVAVSLVIRSVLL